ncbi:MAG: NAD(P)H-dependent oxidoreductase subunit E [Candidatus Zixiibacteriota bacterium]|nr:MAG: NAD(P)H-dependent oxidoreductase subunit E [candidate division Zixibacteria bacterium]
MTVATESKYDLQSKIEEIVGEYGAKPTALIMILQDVQKHYRYLPEEALRAVAKSMKLPLAQIYGVATFYRAFTLKPTGKNHICVCTGTACHVRQAVVIVDKLERDLGIPAGETTADGEVSLETVNCLGACALGPLVTANGVYYGNMTVTKVEKMLSEVLHKKRVSETTEEAA